MTYDSGKPPLIEVRGLVKKFGRFTALDELDLKVSPGTVHGFLGPNGAGKSTTIRVLLGLYRRQGGTVEILGMDPQKHPATVTSAVAYLPGTVALWPQLTGQQVLDALAGLRGARDEAREIELIEQFELDPSKRVRNYSKGNLQKVILVATLAAPTTLMILDEPTSGLDPLMMKIFIGAIAEEADRGKTVLMSSHVLSEVEEACTAVTIIKKGRTVESGRLDQLQHLSAMDVTIGADDTSLAALTTQLRNQGLKVSDKGKRIHAHVPSRQIAAVLGAVSQFGVEDITVNPISLQDLFLRHYESDE